MYILKLGVTFEWDPTKARANAQKHGVTFDEAVTVFFDTRGLDGPDVLHSTVEPRRLRLGCSIDERDLIVAYTLRSSTDGETTRIISARQANSRDRALFASKD